MNKLAIDLLKIISDALVDSIDYKTSNTQSRHIDRAVWLISQAQEDLEDILTAQQQAKQGAA